MVFHPIVQWYISTWKEKSHQQHASQLMIINNVSALFSCCALFCIFINNVNNVLIHENATNKKMHIGTNHTNVIILDEDIKLTLYETYMIDNCYL